MDIAQAISQKLMLAFTGTVPSRQILGTLRHRPIGGVTLFRAGNVADPMQVCQLTAALQQAAAAGGHPPLLVGADQEGGQLIAIHGTTPFPGNLALAATGSVDLARRTGHAIGRELAAMGINVNYAPVCDVNINPQNPVVGTRSFGEDPAIVARMATAMVEGMQLAGVAATAKHFPGHGDTSSDSHHGLIVVPHGQERLQRVELPPFAAAIAAGVTLVMTAHVALPTLTDGLALPATLAPQIVRGLLRGELGFTGLIISDAMDMGAIGSGAARVIDAVAAVAAGVDLLLLHSDVGAQQQVYDGLVHAAQRGLLSRSDLIDSAERVLALKRWLAEQPRPSPEVIGSSEHQALAAEVAARAITLVRDDAGLLPLRLPAAARVAVVVPQPIDLTPADTSSYVTCELARAVRRYHSSVDDFVIPADPAESQLAALRQRLVDYELVIIGTINATGQPGQAALVNTILAADIPTIAVALRMPYDLSSFPTAPVYLSVYSVLSPSMDALADALWGAAPIDGRLPVSIPGLYSLGHGLGRATSKHQSGC